MRSKGEFYETLSDIFARDDMPPTCVCDCDSTKELIEKMSHNKIMVHHIS